MPLQEIKNRIAQLEAQKRAAQTTRNFQQKDKAVLLYIRQLNARLAELRWVEQQAQA